MANLIAALNANSIVLANAASNVANLNTQDYKSICTTIVQGSNGNPAAVTQRTTTQGTPIDEEYETSNVDLPQEYNDMILSQRGYEAALSAIEVREELLKDLMDVFVDR
jgi:flagellar hook protein FlgE